METSRYLARLAADYALLRSAVAAAPPDARVPSCPDWTAADLAEHLAGVYRHKVHCIEHGEFPRTGPPAQPGGTPPESLDLARAALDGAFAAHPADAFAATFYPPQQTVGFWIRRMAQETAMHRVDAEQAAGRPVTPIAGDLAEDGIDEVLTLFLAYKSSVLPEEFADALRGADGRAVAVSAGGRTWTVEIRPDRITAAEEPPARPAATVAADTPDVLLRWLWNRTGGLPAGAVTVAGDRALLDRFQVARETATR